MAIMALLAISGAVAPFVNHLDLNIVPWWAALVIVALVLVAGLVQMEIKRRRQERREIVKLIEKVLGKAKRDERAALTRWLTERYGK